MCLAAANAWGADKGNGVYSMKKVIILSGVSGTGKTHARLTLPELKDLPFVDIADIYREWPEFDWQDAVVCLCKRVRKLLAEHDTVVAEGYFQKRSHSLRMLENDLSVLGVKSEVWVFWEPLGVCEQRLIRQWKHGEYDAVRTRKRMDLLHRCWKPREE